MLEGSNTNDLMLLDKWGSAYVASMHVAVVVHKYNKLNPQSQVYSLKHMVWHF